MAFIYEAKYSDERYFNDVRELLFLCGRYGIDKITPDKSNPEIMEKFQIEVHNGWKLAQSKIKDIVLEILDEISVIEALLKESKVKKNREEIAGYNLAISRLNFRLQVIRKFIDGIIWNIHGLQEHYLRRLFSGKNIVNINRKDISELFGVIDYINEDEKKIAISCDLSTFVHIGDYIFVDLQEKSSGIVELKTGKKNSQILESMERFYEHKCIKKFFNDAEIETEKDFKQFQRILNQKKRAQNFLSIKKNDEGEDFATGLHIKLTKDEIEVDTFEDVLTDMYNELSQEKTWAIGTVDECLFLGMYHKDCTMPPHFIFSKWMELLGVKSRIIDYRSVFMVNMSRPPLMTGIPSDLIDKIYLEEIVVVMCLDLPLLINTSRKNGIDISLGKPKESRKLITQKKGVSFVTIDGCILKVKTPSGNVVMADGILTKIYYSMQTPLTLMKAMCQP